MRLLVCGGRDFSDHGLFQRVMIDIGNQHGPTKVIISGGAPGADTMARQLAKAWRLTFLQFNANWKEFGRAAGVIRNQEMLEEGKPDMVVAFPGGKGTADMINRARIRGVHTLKVHADGRIEELRRAGLL